jgi:hypothetical protein
VQRAFAGLLFALAALTAGCQEDLPKATEIEHMRILGVGLSVVGDPTRSTPKPGESVQATFATVYPSPKKTDATVQAMLIGCTAPEHFTGGLPACQEFLDAANGKVGTDVNSVLDIAGQMAASDPAKAMGMDAKLTCDDLPMPKIRRGQLSIQCLRGDPTAVFDVAPTFKADRMLFVGVVCEQGTAFIDPNDPLLFGCDGNKGETTQVNGMIPVQHGAADENHNPSIDDLDLVLTTFTDPWVAPEGELPPADDCEDDAQTDQSGPLTLPLADPGKHDILLEYEASARERTGGDPEELEFTIYTTAGEMERRFTLFGAEAEPDKDGKLRASVEWDPPAYADLPSKGKLVRFFVTLRDHRGGFAITTRTACVF